MLCILPSSFSLFRCAKIIIQNTGPRDQLFDFPCKGKTQLLDEVPIPSKNIHMVNSSVPISSIGMDALNPLAANSVSPKYSAKSGRSTEFLVKNCSTPFDIIIFINGAAASVPSTKAQPFTVRILSKTTQESILD